MAWSKEELIKSRLDAIEGIREAMRPAVKFNIGEKGAVGSWSSLSTDSASGLITALKLSIAEIASEGI